jgi:glycosyltransferase involved in cell wall biosynthesis
LKVLICGDSFKNITGLNEVSFNIIKYFYNKGYEVGYCVISGESCKPDDLKKLGNNLYEYFFDTPLFNCQKEQSNFDTAIQLFKPDIVFSAHDLWKLEKIMLSDYRSTYKWIAYCPIESDYYSDHIVLPDKNSFRKSLPEIVNNIDLIIPYTDMGKRVLQKLGATNITEKVFNGIEDIYIESVNRQEVFKGLVKDSDFIFMTNTTNFQRKGLAYIIEAFNSFVNQLDNRENYKLYIHGQIDTIDQGTDIKSMVIDLELSNNVIYSKNEQISKRELYKRYRCCDCYIGLPLAEGFGLPFAEAMINKLPIISSGFGGHIEYLQQTYEVGYVSYFYPNNQYTLWKIPQVDEAVCGMFYYTNNLTNIKERTKENYNYAKENLTWDKVYKRFDEILKPFLDIYIQSIDNKLTLRRII